MNRIEQLKSFMASSPNDSFLIHALALEYIKIGDDEEALKFFKKNKEENPGYVATYYHLGKLYERTGFTESAIEIYSQGMEIAKAAADNHSFSELRSVYEELIY